MGVQKESCEKEVQLTQGAFYNYIKSSRALELLTVAELHLLAQLIKPKYLVVSPTDAAQQSL